MYNTPQIRDKGDAFMSRSRVVHHLLCFALLFGVLGGVVGNQVVLATQESNSGSFLLPLNQDEPPPEDKLELSCKYPSFEGNAGDSFEFEVGLRWLGSEVRVFDLAITEVPPKWRAAILAGYPEKEIPTIGLEPVMKYPEKITVKFAPLLGELPEPGEYGVTLEASSGDIKETVELKAVVTAQYMFAFYTASGRLNTEVTAGKENHLSLMVANTGRTLIDKIDLLSEKPSGWSIDFNLDEVESLEPGMAQEVDMVIKPPSKTIAGDYMITLTAISKGLPTRQIELRVTALTPTVWGWVAILIVLAVIAGLGVIFWRLGRR